MTRQRRDQHGLLPHLPVAKCLNCGHVSYDNASSKKVLSQWKLGSKSEISRQNLNLASKKMEDLPNRPSSWVLHCWPLSHLKEIKTKLNDQVFRSFDNTKVLFYFIVHTSGEYSKLGLLGTLKLA